MPSLPGTIAWPLLRAMHGWLRSCGVATETLTAGGTGPAPGRSDDAATRVSAADFRRALRLLHDAGPRPVRNRLESASADYPELMGAVLNAPTLRDALACFATYHALINQLAELRLTEEGAVARLLCASAVEADHAGTLALLVFELLGQIIRAYGAGSSTRFAVALTRAPPARAVRVAWDGFFRGPVAYGAREDALEFARAELDRTAPNNRCAQPILARRLEGRLRELTGGASLVERVEDLFRRELATGSPDLRAERILARIRAESGLDARAVRRALARERVNLRALVNRVKLDEARRLLRDTGLSLAEVSERLGFNSQSSLTRFFRNETGVAPLVFRKTPAGAHPCTVARGRAGPDGPTCASIAPCRASRCCRPGS